jgi:hypothetical protein
VREQSVCSIVEDIVNAYLLLGSFEKSYITGIMHPLPAFWLVECVMHPPDHPQVELGQLSSFGYNTGACHHPG